MTIKEMAELVGLSADTLRYYERIGVIPTVTRTTHGIRNYDEVDLEWIQSILRLKASGMTLEMIIEYVRLANQGDHTIEARKNLLEEEQERISAKIEELQGRLATINNKIDDYYDDLLPKTTAMINKMNREDTLS
ncbi:MerR family transcriptional regulator [Enterococcus crotali]|uniref:MerR family transcriptional regulator n=1 Tax=Enterococcus crotali TaxID=1453587 RepID=UPI00047017A0|nr:MerR family transcriptional regulator [Enterococcus crotali]